MILAYIILFTFIGSVASLAGSFFLIIKKSLTESLSDNLVSFAAGVLIGVAFLELLPEAVESARGNSVFLPALAGFIAFFFAEKFIHLFHHHHGHGEHPTVLLVMLGDSIHNFVDGVVITAGFLTNVPLGITTSFAVAAHEIPQEIADMGVLLSRGLSKTRALIFNFLSALTAMIGALVAFFFSSFVENNIYIFLSASAGFFIYISASDLIPELHEKFIENRKFSHSFIFLFGVILVVLFSKVFEG